MIRDIVADPPVGVVLTEPHMDADAVRPRDRDVLTEEHGETEAHCVALCDAVRLVLGVTEVVRDVQVVAEAEALGVVLALLLEECDTSSVTDVVPETHCVAVRLVLLLADTDDVCESEAHALGDRDPQALPDGVGELDRDGEGDSLAHAVAECEGLVVRLLHTDTDRKGEPEVRTVVE